MSLYNVWLLFIVASLIGCAVGALVWDAASKHSRRHFHQRDWVAEQKRKHVSNGFKARIGAR